MNIYNYIPLIAMVAYIPLLVTTISARPLSKKHKLFLLFLISAIIWSLVDFIARSDFLPQLRPIWLRLILLAFTLTAVQFHCFTSSFFPSGKRRWLPFAYGSLIVVAILLFVGFSNENIVAEGGKLYPQYGNTTIIMVIPLLILLGRNIYLLAPLLKHQENPVVYNQTITLIIGLVVLAVFGFVALLPWGREYSLSHIANIVNAILLSYAVVGHHLVDIRFVLRRGLIWLSIAAIGLASFWTMLLIFHAIFKIELTPMSMFAASISGVIAVVIIYKMQDVVTRLFGKAFQGDTYYHREKLSDFVNKIHNVFSLKEQGGNLLNLVTHAIGCGKACLLFPDPNDDFEVQLIDPIQKDSPLFKIKLRKDNPIIEYLKQERRPLTSEHMETSPEFMGLWAQEKEAIEKNKIELFIPLISRERLIGILILDKKTNGRYNLEDYNLLDEITSRVSVSIEKEYLREQLKESQEYLSIINRSNAIISSSLDIQRIYDNFIKELKQVVDVDWAAIGVVEDSEINFMAVFTEIGSPWKVGERIPLKGTANEWLINHPSHALIEPDLNVESQFFTGKYYLQHSIRSIAHLPLIISNEVIGTLSVASRKPDAYNSRHLKLLEQLASQIAMPIENARLYAKTEHMARVDSMTGLLNRRSMDEILPSEIGRHSRYGGVFSVIILDLDSFKSLNDNYGHLAGDELLRQIGIIMKDAIREADRAFRYGGDEFAILLPQTTIDAALKVAERIRQQTYAMIEIGSKPISISLGLASWPADGVNAHDLIASADSALYRAKRSGGNRSQCSLVRLNSVANERAKIDITNNQDSSALSAIFALAATVDARDILTTNHSKQVHEYAIAIGEGLGLDNLEINRLGTCALLHDVGKIGISDEILNKKETLTEKEWEIIKSHPQLGAAIASHSTQLSPCVIGILHHHEKYNGEGYPDGLKNEEIPLESRILAIADAFASMTSDRVYSQTFNYESAIEEIKNGAGKQFDPKLVEVFLSVIPKTVEYLNKVKIGSEKIDRSLL